MLELSSTELKERLSKVKLLAMDVDGVLTDGGLYYSDSGEEFKKFNVKDGQGLKIVMKAGVEVAFISASTSTSILHRAKKLGIAHVFIGVEDKQKTLTDLCNKLELSFSQVAYVGDDINDLSVMESVSYPLTVADAISEVKKYAIYTTQQRGGYGAVREICNLIMNSHKV